MSSLLILKLWILGTHGQASYTIDVKMETAYMFPGLLKIGGVEKKTGQLMKCSILYSYRLTICSYIQEKTECICYKETWHFMPMK